MAEKYNEKAVARLKRISGQIEGLIRMIENGKSTNDVLVQLLAVKGAISGIAPLLLESHFDTQIEPGLKFDGVFKKRRIVSDLKKIYHLFAR